VRLPPLFPSSGRHCIQRHSHWQISTRKSGVQKTCFSSGGPHSDQVLSGFCRCTVTPIFPTLTISVLAFLQTLVQIRPRHCLPRIVALCPAAMQLTDACLIVRPSQLQRIYPRSLPASFVVLIPILASFHATGPQVTSSPSNQHLTYFLAFTHVGSSDIIGLDRYWKNQMPNQMNFFGS
jgi:hypothetical protein